jgi:hypothetical protein
MEMTRIDLRAAKLCMELDCNTIFDTALYRHCPTCGSVEFYPLESWLNRERLPKASALARATVAFPPRALWPSRLRSKRAEIGTRGAAEPLKPGPRALGRRAG